MEKFTRKLLSLVFTDAPSNLTPFEANSNKLFNFNRFSAMLHKILKAIKIEFSALITVAVLTMIELKCN